MIKKDDFVIVRIARVTHYGAFGELEEYPGWQCFIHISEVAPHWVKNIRNYVREGQVKIVKVLRVYPDKKSCDGSLKRVTPAMAKRKMEEVKRNKRGTYLLEIASKEIGKSPDEIKNILLEHYGDLYTVFEIAAIEGKEGIDAPISEEWKEVIERVARKYVELPRKTVRKVVHIVVPGPYGARTIRERFSSIKVDEHNTSVNFFYDGSPRYVVEVTSYDYKVAERVLSKILEELSDIMVEVEE